MFDEEALLTDAGFFFAPAAAAFSALLALHDLTAVLPDEVFEVTPYPM